MRTLYGVSVAEPDFQCVEAITNWLLATAPAEEITNAVRERAALCAKRTLDNWRIERELLRRYGVQPVKPMAMSAVEMV